MNRKGILRGLVILLILGLDIWLDRASKIYVRNHVTFSETIPVIKGFFTIIRTENTGAFLSLGDSLQNPWRFILLNLIPALALGAGLIYILVKTSLNKLNLLGIILIIAGGVGNLYDRIAYGSVTDFMHMDFKIFQTGIFNVADMSIMAGMGLIIVHTWLNDRENKKKQQAAGDAEAITA